MELISIFFLIVIIIQSAILLYYIEFHPDAKECMKLEDNLRDVKKENDNLLKQIRDLNYQVYALNLKVSQYDDLEVARMAELLTGSMKDNSNSSKE